MLHWICEQWEALSNSFPFPFSPEIFQVKFRAFYVAVFVAWSLQQSLKLILQEYKYGTVTVLMVQYLCCARVSEARAVYCTVKALSSIMGLRSLFLVDQALDSYWSKIRGIALLIFALFTSLAQKNNSGNLLFVQFSQSQHREAKIKVFLWASAGHQHCTLCCVFLELLLQAFRKIYRHVYVEVKVSILNVITLLEQFHIWILLVCMKLCKLLAISFSFNLNNFQSAKVHLCLYMPFCGWIL